MWWFYSCLKNSKLCHWSWSRYIDDVIKWKHFPRCWPFVRGIHRSPVNSPHKGQRCGALMFPLICVGIDGWINNRNAGDLRRYCAHYDVSVMYIDVKMKSCEFLCIWFTDLPMCNQQKSNMVVLWRIFVMKTHDNVFNPDGHFFSSFTLLCCEQSCDPDEPKISYTYRFMYQSVLYMIVSFPLFLSFCRIYLPPKLLTLHHHLHYQNDSVKIQKDFTPPPLDKMAAISQTIVSNAIFSMKMYEFRLEFFWGLFPMIQSIIFYYWLR